MSYGICLWDPDAFEQPNDYIPTSLSHAEDIRWQQLEGREDDDGNIIDPPPVLPENPKFAAFLADLQDMATQDRFSTTFRSRYGNCTTTALEDAKNQHYVYMTLPAPYYSDDTGEHILALYELVQRHRLVMFDQDHWLVIRPDGSTLPREVKSQLPRLQQQLQRLKQEHLSYSVDSGKLPQQIQTLGDYFIPSIDAYFASRGYQREADSQPVHLESSCAQGSYIKQTKMVTIHLWISIKGSLGEYRAYVGCHLFVPAIDTYLQHVKDTAPSTGSHRFEVNDERLHHQLLKQPSDIEAYLAKCQPILDFLDQINDLEQLLALRLKPDPFNPDAKVNQSTSPYIRLYADLPAMVLMRMINKPEKYVPIMDQSYQYALTCNRLLHTPSRYYNSPRYPKTPPREVFLRDWATLTKLLDRDYPASESCSPNSLDIQSTDLGIVSTDFFKGSLEKGHVDTSVVLQALDHMSDHIKSLPQHSMTSENQYTRELYATLLAAVLCSDGQVTESQRRLFEIVLQCLQLDVVPTRFFESTQQFNADRLQELIRTLNHPDQQCAFVIDALILTRLDGLEGQLQPDWLAGLELSSDLVAHLSAVAELGLGRLTVDQTLLRQHTLTHHLSQLTPMTAIAWLNLITHVLPERGLYVDAVTGLMWSRISIGQQWVNGKPEGAAVALTWDEGYTACQEYRLGGFDDWRIPTKDELATLMIAGKAGYHAPNGTLYPPDLSQASSFGMYWSTSSYTDNHHSVWYASFHFGYLDGYFKDYGRYYIRAIR